MLDLSITTDLMRARTVLCSNRRWFDDNLIELQKEYGGKVIAVHDEQVRATGLSAPQVEQEIAGKYSFDETLVIMVPFEEVRMIPYPE